MTDVFINQIATAVPAHDMHQKFVEYAPSLLDDAASRKLFSRMADRAQIEHRFSYLSPHEDPALLDNEGFYRREQFPDTGARMQFYEQHAFTLAKAALDQLEFAERAGEVTHLIVTTCTGFYAPGVDQQIVEHYKLSPSVERTIIGFMGCYAAINGLKMARHIVRSEPSAKVIVLNLELCTLHLMEESALEPLLSFLLFADGCAAALISSEPDGIELQSFYSTVVPASSEQITWHIGQSGFRMWLSGQVPLTLSAKLPGQLERILGGKSPADFAHWAIHPGGRSILDAVEKAVELPATALHHSREILRRFGNMSSATIMFVLKEMLMEKRGGKGCGMAFGPGLTTESMLFECEGAA